MKKISFEFISLSFCFWSIILHKSQPDGVWFHDDNIEHNIKA